MVTLRSCITLLVIFGAYVCVLSDFRDGFLVFRVRGNVTMLRNMNTLLTVRTDIKITHLKLGLNIDNSI